MQTRSKIRKNEAGAAAGTAEGETQAEPAAATGAGAAAVDPAAQVETPAVSLDELNARVEEAAKALEQTEKEMTPPEFEAYVAEQLEKAGAEPAEKAQPRIKALQAAMALAKTAFEGSSPVPVRVIMFNDSWQLKPQAKSIAAADAQPTSGMSNVAFPNKVDTAKRAIALAKHLSDDKSEVRKTLAKSAEGTTVLAKAGEASTMLEGLAAMFGVSAMDGSDSYYQLSWKISDIIRTVERAAEMESAMSKLSAALGGGAAPAEPAAEPAPVEAAATTPEEAQKAALAKAAGLDDYGVEPIVDKDGWPLDMGGSTRASSKKSAQAEEEIRF